MALVQQPDGTTSPEREPICDETHRYREWAARHVTAATTRRHGRRAGSLSEASRSEYTADEVEFMMAMDAWKRDRHRPYPTCCEVLEVLRSLGYRKSCMDEKGR